MRSSNGDVEWAVGRLAPPACRTAPLVPCEEPASEITGVIRGYYKYVEKNIGQFPGSELDDFTDAIKQEFFRSMETAVGLGRWIGERMREGKLSQKQVADQLGVNQSAVCKWCKTDTPPISIGHFLRFFLRFGGDVPPLPPLTRLHVVGYCAATTLVWEKLNEEACALPLDRERFWCLLYAYSDEDWYKLRLARAVGSELNEAARHILAKKDRRLGPGEPAVTTPEELKKVLSDWGQCWVICFSAVGAYRVS